MAKDIKRSHWSNTPDSPSTRLCNFATGASTLRPAHQEWLARNIVPILGSDSECVGTAKLSPAEWEKIAELVKASREALGVDPNARKPQLAAFDIPLAGAALEVSVYKWRGTVSTIR